MRQGGSRVLEALRNCQFGLVGAVGEVCFRRLQHAPALRTAAGGGRASFL